MARGWQQAEGGLVLVAMLVLYVAIGAPLGLWLALLVFLSPDLAFASYLAGPRVGAATYNLLHLYGTGAALAALGVVLALPWLLAMGVLWMAHAGLDRMLGYGLKLPQGFSLTHLGPIGRRQNSDN